MIIGTCTIELCIVDVNDFMNCEVLHRRAKKRRSEG
jgi:hypothetical protein